MCYAYRAFISVFLYQVFSSVVVSGLWFCNFAYGYLGSLDSMTTAFLVSFSMVYQHGQFSLYGFGLLYLVNPNPGTVCMY